jgi:hypothetical protein
MTMSNPKTPTPRVGSGHSFATVPQANIERSAFDLSHTHKTTFDSGYLVPVFSDEVLAGDTWSVNATMLIRMAPAALLTPLMDDVFIDLHWWFVPFRLVWAHFVNFMGETSPNPSSSTNYTVPLLTSPVNGFAVGSLFDHFGLPCTPLGSGAGTINVNTLELRSYNLIYNTWYRDQNLINGAVFQTGDTGTDNLTDFVLQRRGKRHDQFTSALPWPQKGSAVSIPLTGTAPVQYVPYTTNSNPMLVRNAASDALYGSGPLSSNAGTGVLIDSTLPANHLYLDPNGRLVTNLAAATAVTINAFRLAVTIQQLLERDARGGTRFTEIIHSHFGVVSPDARLQRPEFLGSSMSTIGVYTVPQASGTGATGTTTAQGNLAAFGISKPSSNGWTHSFTEPGTIIAIANARARYTYTQGLARRWSRQTRYDFYWPTFAMLGEQSILNQELFVNGDGATNDQATFGYQERWYEYRNHPSLCTALFRTNVALTLDAWHLAQNFASVPALNQTFIEENPPIARVVAVPSQPQFFGDFHFQIKAVRPLPVFSVPGLTRL